MAKDTVLFSTDTMRKVLTGRITAFRQEIKPQPLFPTTADVIIASAEPVYSVGEFLFVRETFCRLEDGTRIYRASYDTEEAINWKPGFFMEEEDFRYRIQITSVNPQMLSDMTREDILAEGIGTRASGFDRLQREYQEYWDSLHTDSIRNKDKFQYRDDLWTWKYTFKLKKIRGR